MPEFETEITVRVRIEYGVLPGERGSRDRYGLPETPDFPDEFEITAVTPLDDWLVAKNGEPTIEDWRLPKEVQEQFEDEAEDDARAAAEAALEP